MDATVNWLDYSSFFVSVFMALVAIAATTISYSVFAANTSPEVIVHLEQDPDARTIFLLVIQNIGNGAAKNVKFIPESPLPQEAFGMVGDAQMPKEMDHGPIISGIPYMAPGSSRTIMLGQYGGLEKWLNDKSLTINIECERANKFFGVPNVVRTSSSIDIHSFLATDASDNSHAKGIRDELKKLNKEVSQLRALIQKQLKS